MPLGQSLGTEQLPQVFTTELQPSVPLQSLGLPHCTQMWNAQMGVPGKPAQSVLETHCAQTLSDVQMLPLPHWPSLVHCTQRPLLSDDVSVSQYLLTLLGLQAPADVVHGGTQAPVFRLQMSPELHCDELSQPQAPEDSQTGALPPQPVLSAHTQLWPLQVSPVGHSPSELHEPQRPAWQPMSEYGQSAGVTHCTQVLVAPSQSGVCGVPVQSLSARQSTQLWVDGSHTWPEHCCPPQFVEPVVPVEPVEPPWLAPQAPALQYGVALGQSKLEPHGAQDALVVLMQRGSQPPEAQPSPTRQSLLSEHWPQLPATQASAAEQSLALRHATHEPVQ